MVPPAAEHTAWLTFNLERDLNSGPQINHLITFHIKHKLGSPVLIRVLISKVEKEEQKNFSG